MRECDRCEAADSTCLVDLFGKMIFPIMWPFGLELNEIPGMPAAQPCRSCDTRHRIETSCSERAYLSRGRRGALWQNHTFHLHHLRPHDQHSRDCHVAYWRFGRGLVPHWCADCCRLFPPSGWCSVVYDVWRWVYLYIRARFLVTNTSSSGIKATFLTGMFRPSQLRIISHPVPLLLSVALTG
jgi:hypothetical protein